MGEYSDESLDSFILVNHAESFLMDVPSIEISTSSLGDLKNSRIVKSMETEDFPYLIVDSKTTIERNQLNNDNSFSQDSPENLKLTHQMYNNFEIIEPPESIPLKGICFNQEVFENGSITCKDNILISKDDFTKSLDVIDEMDFRVNILNINMLGDTWTPNLHINKNDEVNTEDISNVEHCEKETDCDASINLIDDKSNFVETYDNTTNECMNKEAECKRTGVNVKNIAVDLSLPLDTNNVIDFKINNELLYKSDDVDFRVNILDRNMLDDSWTPNQYIDKEDEDKNENHNESGISTNINIKNNSEMVVKTNVNCHTVSSQSELKLDSQYAGALSMSISEDRLRFLSGFETPVHHSDEIRVEIASADINVTESDDNYFSTDETDNNIGQEDIGPQPQIINYMKDEDKIAGVPKNWSDSIINNESLVIPNPIRIGNPLNFKSMNSVIGMLFNCFDFRTEMIKYHRSDNIANIDLDVLPDVTVNDVCFVNDLCMLFTLLKENGNNKCQHVAQSIKKYILNDDSLELDVYQGFQYILRKINAITKTMLNEPITSTEQEDIDFYKYKFDNYGFISDLFYGQISQKYVCENCRCIHSERYQPINSISLNIQKLSSYNLDDCIKDYFNPTIVKILDNYKCCDQPVIKIFQEITHAPEYFFIYLDRKWDNGFIEDVLFETDNGFLIQTKKGLVLYSLISVIDHDVTNESNHHIVKCLIDHWWSIDNYSTQQIQECNIITNLSVGFMLKKLNEN